MKLLKLFKRSVWFLLAALVLLYVQAQCDLALPSYLSDIVDTGISQSGIENAAASTIRAGEMDKLLLFATDEETKTISSSYTLQDNLYTLKTAKSGNNDAVSSALVMPMTIVFALSNSPESSAQFSLPEGTDIFTFLLSADEGTRKAMTSAIRDSFAGYAEIGTLTDQMAVQYVRGEYIAQGLDVDKMQTDYIFKAGMKMLLFALLIAAAMIAIGFLSAKISANFSRDARRAVFGKVISFSGAEQNKFSTASLITRCTNDIQQIQMLIMMTVRIVIYAPILGIGAILKIQGSNMTWVIALAVGCILVLILSLLAIAMPKFSRLQKLIDRINLVSREILTGLPVIRAFSREKYEIDRFDKANKDQIKTSLFVNRCMSFMMPAMMFLLNCVSLLIIWVAAGLINDGQMQVGEMVAFTQYAMMIIMAFLMLSMMSIQLPRAIVSIRRVNEVLNTKTSIVNHNDTVSLDSDKRGEVVFDKVSFRYPGAEEYVLKDISFTASRGQTVAIIGSTGAGKTTLLNLIPRFYDVTEGSVTVDGVDVRQADIPSLRKVIGYVPQKALLFSGTVESNIAYALGESHSQADVERAAEIAQASAFIAEKPEGFESSISQGGTNVSGGQRQRLAIARAVAKNADIYLFDDSFSALDFKTDTSLRKALGEHMHDATKIIVAQRISTVLNADEILVLDNGELVGKGTHKELMQSCEAYRDIALSQLSESEAENNG